MKRILHALTTLCILSISITEAIAQTKVSFIPEITLIGNNEEIPDGDTLPITKNNTHFGNVGLTTKVIKEFIIENDGPSPLIVSDISFSGENASEFRLSETPTFPINIESNQHYKIQVVFAPTFGGTRSAFLNIINNDLDESLYNVLLQGEATFTTVVECPVLFSGLKVYPNPSADEATIELASAQQQSLELHVVNLQGQEMKAVSETIFSKGYQHIDLNTSDLDDGLYYITIIGNVGKESVKLFVQH